MKANTLQGKISNDEYRKWRKFIAMTASYTSFRGPGFLPHKWIREARTDVFGESAGVLLEDGEKWRDIRSKVQQDLMRPKSAIFYFDEIQKVSDEFMNLIRHRKSKNMNVINDFLPQIYRYTFESIVLIALDTRLGCLKEPMSPEFQKVFDDVHKFMSK